MEPEKAAVDATVDELIPLVDAEQDAKWAIGDVLVRRIHPDGIRIPSGSHANNGANGWFTTVARALAEHGREIKEEALRKRYRTSLAFPVGTRHSGVAWATHEIIASSRPASEAPARMVAFLTAMTAQGTNPSKRAAQEFLGLPITAVTGGPATLAYIETHPDLVPQAISVFPDVVQAILADAAALDAIIGYAADNGPRAPRDKSKPRDYGRLIESAVNSINVALLAAKSGEYELTSRDEALLYFATRLLGQRLAPQGDLADLLPAKLNANLDEIERYANAGGIQ